MNSADIAHASLCKVGSITDPVERNENLGFQFDPVGELIGIGCMSCGSYIGDKPLVGDEAVGAA